MMKKLELVALVFLILLASCSTDSDESDDDNFDASVVCPAEGTNAYGMPNRGTFVDERDGQEYKYTTIGNQVWMAENLRYVAENSKCYDDKPENCEIYGRMYSLNKDWEDYAAIDTDFAASLCPKGWSLPSITDWDDMVKKMGGYDNGETANRLRSSLYWPNATASQETDACGFSIKPSGICWGRTNCYNLSENTGFWSSTRASLEYEMQGISYTSNEISKGGMFYTLPVRCIKN